MEGHIRLFVTFSADYIGSDAPAGDTGATETVELTLPYIDGKYIVMPKLLEGVMDKTIEAHRGKLYRENAKMAEEKRIEREKNAWQQMGLVGEHEG